VTGTGLGLSGADAGNYTVNTTDETLADITAKGLILSGITAANKVYDAGTAATVSTTDAIYTGLTSGDLVSVSATGLFSDENVADGKTVTLTSGYTGADVSNYSITDQATTLANITPATLGVNAATDTKVYNATTSSTGVVTFTGLQGSDSVTGATQTYASKNVMGLNGSTLQVNAGYSVNDGNGGANYTVTENTATGTITPAALTVAANSQSKVYGTSDPALTYTASGLQIGDTAGGSLSGALARLAGENVGIYAIGQNTLASNANYTVAYTGADLGITPAALNVTAHSQSKVFGQPDPTLTYDIAGLVNNPALGIADTADSVFSGALTRVPGESAIDGPYAITRGSLAANSNYTMSSFSESHLTITGAAAEPVLGFNAGQVIFAGVINNEFSYRPGNFWHISLNPSNADPGFDVMRGTRDLNAPLNRSDPDFTGDFFETWTFPQQFEKVDQK